MSEYDPPDDLLEKARLCHSLANLVERIRQTRSESLSELFRTFEGPVADNYRKIQREMDRVTEDLHLELRQAERGYVDDWIVAVDDKNDAARQVAIQELQSAMDCHAGEIYYNADGLGKRLQEVYEGVDIVTEFFTFGRVSVRDDDAYRHIPSPRRADDFGRPLSPDYEHDSVYVVYDVVSAFDVLGTPAGVDPKSWVSTTYVHNPPR